MNITSNMFKAICTSSGVHPRVLDLIRGMGYKSRPTDEHFMGCYCSTQHEPGQPIQDDGITLAPKKSASREFALTLYSQI
jgi:hypothetical protein